MVKKKYKILIEIIGLLIVLILVASIIQDIVILITKNKINAFGLATIRFISALILIYIIIKITPWGKDISNFIIEIENKTKKKIIK